MELCLSVLKHGDPLILIFFSKKSKLIFDLYFDAGAQQKMISYKFYCFSKQSKYHAAHSIFNQTLHEHIFHVFREHIRGRTATNHKSKKKKKKKFKQIFSPSIPVIH